MKNSFLQNLRVPLFLLVSAISMSVVGADAQVFQLAQVQNDCLSRRDAQEATVGGQLMPLQQIYAQNGLKREDVVDRKVCRRNGELYYVLSVYLDGVADTIWINARTGMS